jgi:hypothetical protein
LLYFSIKTEKIKQKRARESKLTKEKSRSPGEERAAGTGAD